MLTIAGCATAPVVRVYETPTALRSELDSDLRTLSSVGAHLEAWEAEVSRFRNQGGWVSRGYFSAAENDRMEHLLFRFLAFHEALWGITAAYQNMQTSFEDPMLDAKVHVISRQASLLLASSSAFLVTEFAEDPVATRKMNEAFYRSEIPVDTYYGLARDITPKRLERLRRADAIATAELANPASVLAQLAASDAVYRPLIASNAKLQIVAEARLRSALEGLGRSAPEPIRKTDEVIEEGLYASRSMLFKDVSRIKNPTAHLIRFSSAQKAEVERLLQPGDLILTYTAGYISDVFIPGAFKHGITYVGSPEKRRRAGLVPEALVGVVPDPRRRLSSRVALAFLDDGKRADMIEAVAEGVIFNNLPHIMDTHINRMLVLRPKLTPTERRDFLIEVFSYLGERYDFRFDFADSTSQVCTEVIYRAINGKGGIDFDLTVRAGHETLSADDIVLYYLDGLGGARAPVERPEAFEFVLYAEEDPSKSDHEARILSDEAGVERLKELMASVGE